MSIPIVFAFFMENTTVTQHNAFYRDGLKFSCTRCSICCRFDPGYVFLSEEDLAALTRRLDIPRNEFEERFCRYVEMDGKLRLSLAEQSNNDCVFWRNGGCSVYGARPLQCRSFPFWPSYLFSEYSWQSLRSYCPGVDIGEDHPAKEIDAWLRAPEKHTYIRRPKSDGRT